MRFAMDNRRLLIEKFGEGRRVKAPLTRCGLYPLFRELGFTVGCEVGVYTGRNAIEILLNNPSLKLYLVDAYNRKQWKLNPNYTHKPMAALLAAKKKMKKIHWKYGCEYKFIIKKSMDAVKDFAAESLDFVYIDADHTYERVLEDITEWSKKVRIGGIISGHDYDRYKFKHFDGVVRAVNEYTTKHKIKPVYFTLDSCSSYFWVKAKRK